MKFSLLLIMRTARFNAKSLVMLCRHYQRAVDHLSSIQTLLGAEKVQYKDIGPYTQDWTKLYQGGGVVCFPSTTQDVSKILKYCNDNKIGVVPQGGNTGLVGAGVGMADELIVSTRRMYTIHSIDVTAGTMSCDAGCVLQDLMTATAKHNLIVPLDLGAKGSCSIGGNVSTNAGGLRVLRYGSMHSNVLGLEVVLADGRVMSMARPLRKDNSGYHLSHMFIGSEGTLGFVTKVVLSLAPLPRYTKVALLKVSSFSAVPALLEAAREGLAEQLSAFEFLDSSAIAAVREMQPHLVNRLGGDVTNRKAEDADAVYVLVEISAGCPPATDGKDRLEEFLEQAAERGVVSEGIVSQSKMQEQAIWSLRENVPVCLAQLCRNDSVDGPFLFKYDISIPQLQEMLEVAVEVKADFRADGFSVAGGHDTKTNGWGNVTVPLHQPQTQQEAIAEGDTIRRECVLSVYYYGHAGDQNLHLNVILSFAGAPRSADVRKIQTSLAKVSLEKAVLRAVKKRQGSISAEHGIGQQKAHLLAEVRSPNEIAVMRALKMSLDPNCILNPGKVFELIS